MIIEILIKYLRKSRFLMKLFWDNLNKKEYFKSNLRRFG